MKRFEKGDWLVAKGIERVFLNLRNEDPKERKTRRIKECRYLRNNTGFPQLYVVFEEEIIYRSAACYRLATEEEILKERLKKIFPE